MNKNSQIIKIILYTLIITIIIALIVFLSGNNPTSQNTQSNTIQQNSSERNSTQTNLPNLQEITKQELSNHNSLKDCWVAYESKVYDITDFLPKHPGSANAITPFCGKSTEFENAFKDQHGQTQVKTLLKEGIYKGELK